MQVWRVGVTGSLSLSYLYVKFLDVQKKVDVIPSFSV